MISFYSPIFILSFFILNVVLYYTKDANKQNLIITVYSLLMYALIDWHFLAILIFEVVVCYFGGNYISREIDNKKPAFVFL